MDGDGRLGPASRRAAGAGTDDAVNADRTAREAPAPVPPRLARHKPSVARTTSQALFRGSDLLLIEHDGETYTLRRTRQGKLILNK